MDLDSIVSSMEDAGLSDVLANFEFDDVVRMAKNPAVMGLLVLAAQVIQMLLPPALNLAREQISETVGIRYVPPLLESNENCGMTTGGKDECWWDCNIEKLYSLPSTFTLVATNLRRSQAITNLECLDDCFPPHVRTEGRRRKGGKGRNMKRSKGKGREKKARKRSRESTAKSDTETDELESDTQCITSLLNDVKKKGTCQSLTNFAMMYNFSNPDTYLWGMEKGKNCQFELSRSHLEEVDPDDIVDPQLYPFYVPFLESLEVLEIILDLTPASVLHDFGLTIPQIKEVLSVANVSVSDQIEVLTSITPQQWEDIFSTKKNITDSGLPQTIKEVVKNALSEYIGFKYDSALQHWLNEFGFPNHHVTAKDFIGSLKELERMRHILKDFFDRTPIFIETGTVSEKTMELLNTTKCHKAIAEQPTAIKNTIGQLLLAACPYDFAYKVAKEFLFIVPVEDQESNSPERKAPVAFVDVSGQTTKTELNFNNTRHRYPWICSLRRKGIHADHLCAVTILSVPPQPSVIVGAAHCTYMCKDGGPRGAFLEACCCTPGGLSCSDDIARCGTNPGAAEIYPDEVIILCGEWETGPSPMRFTGEDYNVPLQVSEIIRHPDFDPEVGVDSGSDLAVFKIVEEGLKKSQADGHQINPICLPKPNRPEPEKGVHSGWGNPLPIYYYNAFGQGFLPFAIDSFKQWHYEMNIYKNCSEEVAIGLGYLGNRLNNTVKQNLEAIYEMAGLRSKALYPPGLICAREKAFQFCPTPGDSGSPLMIKRADKRFYIEGTLSFLKGCQEFSITSIDKEETKFQFSQSAEAPLAYTKLSCFLPWVAKQFGLSYDAGPGTDDACVTGWGERPAIYTGRYDTTCREAVGQVGDPYKRPCIFPYYVDDTLYTECGLFGEPSFIVPVWRCPVYNIRRKKNGINHFLKEEIEDAHGLCLSDTQQPSLLDQLFKDFETDWIFGTETNFSQVLENITVSTEILNSYFEEDTPVIDLLLGKTKELNHTLPQNCSSFLKHRPFSTCKNDCPGVSGIGTIFGGAALFAAGALAGQATLLPLAGLGAAGAAGAIGIGGASAFLSNRCPNTRPCRARDRGNPRRRKCCRAFGTTQGRPRCPRTC